MDRLRVESSLEFLNALLTPLEAWHGRAVAAVHEVHQNQNAVLVFAKGIETLVEEFSEFLEVFGVEPTEDLYILSW